MIDNAYIDTLNDTDGEIDLMLAEALGVIAFPDTNWYDPRPTFYRIRLRRLLFNSQTPVICGFYSQNLTDARAAATTLGASYDTGDSALTVCKKALKHVLDGLYAN